MAMKLRFKVQTLSAETARRDSNPKDRAPVSSLAFVNIDCPAQIKSEATQRKIRRHVMKDIGRSRRRTTVNYQSAAQTAIVVSRSLPASIPSYWGDVKICKNFQRLFRAMDMVSQGLMALVMADSAREFRESLDTIDGTLAPKRLPGRAGSVDGMEQYTESLGLVRKSITMPDSRASRHAVIGTIICLAFLDMRVLNRERWTMHMTGLERVIQVAGGVDILESSPATRQSLFIVDVLGSLVVDDGPPRFKLPRFSSDMPKLHGSKELLAFCQTLKLTAAFDETAMFVIERALNAASRLATLLNDTWKATRLHLDLLLPVSGLTHEVLSLPRMANYAWLDERTRETEPSTMSVYAAAELVRVSVLALLSNVITTTSGDDLYCATNRRSRVRQLLVQSEAILGAGWPELRLWVLVIQALMETGSARRWLIGEILKSMQVLSLQSWDGLVESLRQVVWVEKAALREMEELRSDIEVCLKATAY